MSLSNQPGEDHGLGPEAVDHSTAVAQTRVDPALQTKVERAQSRGIGYWILATVAATLLAEQASFALLLYTPVLPNLATHFHTTQVVWVITALTLAAAVVVPLLSKAADVYGKRRMLLLGTVLVSIGCVVCAIAPNFGVLLAGRVLMAAGSGFLVLVAALIREVFPVRMRALALAIAINGFGVITIGGPLLSGWLVNVWGIQAPFVFQLGICVISGLLAWATLPESPLRTLARIDYLGAALLGCGSFGVLIGLGQVQTRGWGLFTLGFTFGGLVLLVLWWIQLHHSRDPLVNVKLLSRRAMAAPTFAISIYSGVGLGINIVAALAWATPHAIASYGHGLSAFQIGEWSIPAGVLTVLGGVLVGMTVRSIGYRNHMIAAGFLWIIPSIILALNLNASPALIITVYGLYGLAGINTAAGYSLILLAVPEDQRGIATGVTSSIGGIIGGGVQQMFYAILSGSVLTVAYGAAFYTAAGLQGVFYASAGLSVLGLIVSLLIPHGHRQPRSASRRDSAALQKGETAPVN